MRSCDCVELLLGREISEQRIAEAAGGFFDGFGGFAGARCGFSNGVNMVRVEWKVEPFGERADEIEVGVGLGSAKAVVKMRDVEDEAQFPALLMECAEERYGVGSAGDADGEAQPWD